MKSIFDEAIFPDAWRINAVDCQIPLWDKQKVVFLHPSQSGQLWQSHISIDCAHLMEMPLRDAHIIRRKALDFSCGREGGEFFAQELQRFSLILFFWGKQSACLLPKNIFVSHWRDFFYPSDESSILYIPNSHKKIFSHGEDMFVGRFTARHMRKGRVDS